MRFLKPNWIKFSKSPIQNIKNGIMLNPQLFAHHAQKTKFVVITCTSLSMILCGWDLIALAQTANTNQSNTVGENSSFNQVNQNSQQVPVNNTNNNSTNINNPNIYPLNYLPNAFVNTENDFGFNLSAGINTLDAANITIYLGLIYQPGRTEDHNLRMMRLRKETELLEKQKQTMEANLTLLQTQIQEANLRLEQLKKSPVTQ